MLCLQQPTADGSVFRVDMRLRPFGDAGPLAMSYPAAEEYYQVHGRDWERYALIKARPVAGDFEGGHGLLARLQPFVYRRYLEFGALSALREMKELINAEVARRGLHDNIKLGPGGIREIEFIGQVFQLTRGGRDPAYRARGIREVLALLGRERQLPEGAADELLAAYEFLRRCENRLQMENDRQTHQLPAQAASRARLAAAMGYAGWEDFVRALDRHRERVRVHFDEVFNDAGRGTKNAADTEQLASVWNGASPHEAAQAVLQRIGFPCADLVLDSLRMLRESRLYASLSARGQQRMNRLIPVLLEEIARSADPCAAFPRLMQFLESVGRRSVYLALLSERRQVLEQLIRLMTASAWIAEHLSRHPVLLDELLDPSALYGLPDRDAWGAEFERELGLVEAGDLEAAMECIRTLRHAAVFRVAASDIMNVLPLMKVSDHLTWIAEAVLETCLNRTWGDLVSRHGEPTASDGKAGFAVIGYGKLGGIELGYGSDLDLVFLHDTPEGQTEGPRRIENPVFFARLAQRLVHMISTYTRSGIAYAVDTRLRPNGNSGALVSSLGAFDAYQSREAWTWEHQALVRARAVAGSRRIGEAFRAVRGSILTQPRDAIQLQHDVKSMRRRMREQSGARKPGVFDLKQHPGGIVDIEFMLQYKVLAHAGRCPRLTDFTDNIRILNALKRHGLVEASDADFLADAYRAYRGKVHRLTLARQEALIPADEFVAERARVRSIWNLWMSDDD
jgi:[glutamine synthetase] adenylyltransferase / [glutamine synthetase]-adenylyl-L-tyrosine phosphorylase